MFGEEEEEIKKYRSKSLKRGVACVCLSQAIKSAIKIKDKPLG